MRSYYRVPAVIREDIQALERHVEQFKRGELSPGKFRGFRVPLGIYEQRQPNTYMMRVRIPGGGITPSQLRELARLAKVYHVKPHITTRQDIQLQNAQLDHLAPMYRELYKAGLTCKGGGGNTVRNITACPDAGICSDEKFNVLPYAIALTEYLIQFPSSYNLPRKFKIAFSGCSKDCALASVNDLGFIARARDGEVGFSVYVAGGMGARSRVAEQLSDFVPPSEIGYTTEAVKRLFDKHGDRKNKHRARLRFVLEKLGLEKFKQLYEEELRAIREEGPVILDVRGTEEKKESNPKVSREETGNGEYLSWKNRHVRRQKQEGFYSVRIPVPLGDIAPDKLEKVAVLVEKTGEGSLRTAQSQDFLIRWVTEEELPNLHHSLKEVELADMGRPNINYIVCCKGAATCKLGLCLSQGLSGAIAEALDQAGVYLADFPEIDIRINGCPNACGHHPIGSIGLHGGSRRVNGRMAPHYNVSLGGFVEEGKTRLSKPLGYVAAKNIPLLIKDFLGFYRDKRDSRPDFLRFVDDQGEVFLKDLVEKYRFTPSYQEAPEYYIDWASQEEFSLAGRGPGECGAGVLDMIEADLEEATEAYTRYQETKELRHLYNAVVSTSKSLLVTRGLDPGDDLEAFRQFGEAFIESGWVDRKYQGLIESARDYLEKSEKEGLQNNQALVPELIDRLRTLYESMDSNLQFQTAPASRARRAGTVEPEEKAEEEGEKDKIELLDLRGVPCPVNYVKAKVFLESLEVGDLLELLLDEGEPISNVPPSLENDGQEILKIRRENGHFYVKVKKRN